MESKENQKKKRPCVGCEYNDGLFCHSFTCPYEEAKESEDKE